MDSFHLPVLGSVSPAGKLGHVPGAFLRPPPPPEVFFTFLCSLRTSGGVPLFSVVDFDLFLLWPGRTPLFSRFLSFLPPPDQSPAFVPCAIACSN